MNNRILADCHLHTSFSSDSEEAPENVVKKAISLGFKQICFTDHNDYDYPLEDGKVVYLLDFENYYKKMSDLKANFRDQIDIRIGVEQGLQASVASRVDAYDPDDVLDFIIGSSHLINGQDPYYPEFWDTRDVKESIIAYYESIVENLRTCHKFDVYGHLDYIIRYVPGKDADYNWKDYYDYFEAILKTIIEKGKGIEINTAGLKYGLANPNPCPDIIKLYRELGGEIITVGSDAHKVQHFAYDFDVVPGILKEAGFDYYTTFSQRKPEFHKI